MQNKIHLSGAARKKRERAVAKTTFGVEVHTVYLTPAERTWLRERFIRRYKHDWTLQARKRVRDATEPIQATPRNGQIELFEP
jgi:hypothetical protein